MINVLEINEITPRDLICIYDPCEVDRTKADQIRKLLHEQTKKFAIELLSISENMGLSILTRAYSSEEIRGIYMDFLEEKGYTISTEKYEEIRKASDAINEELSTMNARIKQNTERIKLSASKDMMEDYEEKIRFLTAFHQDAINRMQRDHAIETQTLKAKLYDLTEAAKKGF